MVGSLTLFGFGSIKSAWLVFALIPIAVLTELMNPTLDGFISNKVSDDTQGLLQGILSSINAITTILSPLLMTLLFKIGASQKDDWYIPGLPFYFAAILLIICIIPILKKILNDIAIYLYGHSFIFWVFDVIRNYAKFFIDISSV